MNTRNTELLDRIARGVKLLDEQNPGWRRKLDLEELNLGSTKACILGQVYGDYMDGCQALFGKEYYVGDLAREHGFEFYYDPETEKEIDYGMLDKAWREVLDES